MRDPSRIPAVLKELEETWSKFPDWRLGQLIANAVREETGHVNCDPFYIEDEDLTNGIKHLRDKLAL